MLNLQKNYLQKYQQIHPESIEWSLIQYKLQLNLGNSSAYLKKVYCVMNPFLNTQFEKQNKGSIISEVYVKPQSLVESNRIERVCQKGFQFSNNQKGIVFKLGHIDIQPQPQTKMEHQLLIVKICTRKSYPCLKAETEEEPMQCPEGFDSIYYAQSGESSQNYFHSFRLYKKTQTLPYYVIQFSFNTEKQKKKKSIICQKCQDQIAKFYCATESVYFCSKCDYEHHKDKISAQHKRIEYINKPILDFGYCRNHKNIKNQLFCKTCNLAMCMSCKIGGDHTQGSMALHPLSKIEEYYEGTTKKIEQMDPNLQRRKEQLQELLGFVDTKISEVNNQSAKLQKQLNEIFQQCLQCIKTIVHRKLSYLISDQLEIRRQYDYIQWMESFLKYQYQVLTPNDFLTSSTKHAKLRKEVLNMSNIPPITDVKANFFIEGKLKIKQGQHIIGKIGRMESAVQKVRKEMGKDEQIERFQSDFRKKIFFREEPSDFKQRYQQSGE